MLDALSFHNLASVEITNVQSFTAHRTDKIFYHREIRLTDAKGQTFTLNLYSDDNLALSVVDIGEG